MAEQPNLSVSVGFQGYEIDTLKKLFADSPILLCLFEGPNHKIVYANKKVQKIYQNRPLEEGIPARTVWPELKGQGKGDMDIFNRMDYVYSSGESIIINESEVYFDRYNDGNLEQGYFNMAYQPVTDEDGDVQGLLLTGQEVSKRVKARKEKDRLEKRFKVALEGAKLGFFEVDAKDRSFNFLSDQAKKHLGFSPEDEVTYEEFYGTLHPEDVSRVKDMINKAVDESVLYELPVRVYWSDGSLHWILLRGYVITDSQGCPDRRIGIAIDITDQKKTEDKLKRAVKVRDDFLSIASHELQTPVTSIKTRSELLELKLRNDGYKEFAEEAAKIGEQIDELGNLCNNLLDISRLNEGELELQKEWFSMRELIQETLQMLEHLSGHELISRCETEGKVYGDKYRLEQVLINLLNNAIKYSHEADKVIVKLWESKSKLYISVTDFGIGISDKEKKKVFNRFYRGEDEVKNLYPGIGAGLYICEEIIERHQGSIKVENNNGQGSVFTFTLPKGEDHQPK